MRRLQAKHAFRQKRTLTNIKFNSSPATPGRTGKYVALLNDHIEQTTDYVASPKSCRQPCSFALRSGCAKHQRAALESGQGKVQVIVSPIDYLDALEEMVRLSREQDRKAWQNIIADRPPRISTAAIIKTHQGLPEMPNRMRRSTTVPCAVSKAINVFTPGNSKAS